MDNTKTFDIPQKKLGFFGLGKSNLDILSRLPSGKRVILRSEEPLPSLPKTKAHILTVYEGKCAFDCPEEDLLICSPSVRRERKEFIPFRKKGIKFSSDCELFFENVKQPVFAVSGSDGKSTVTALASLLLEERFGKAKAVGNIGVPMLGAIEDGCAAYACELSSFMLSYGRYRVFRGAITNINENHLNWHKDFEEYKKTKISLLYRSSESIASADCVNTKEYLERNSVYGIYSIKEDYKRLKSRFSAQVFYTLDNGYILRNGERMLSLSKIRKKGMIAVGNFLCALSLCDGYVTRKKVLEVAESFAGLAHRCELFYSSSGIDFIDSSVDTTPQRTAATLNSLGRRAVLIMGGRSKGLSFEPLREPLKKFADAVIITGENSAEIGKTLSDLSNIHYAKDISEALEISSRFLKEGSLLLLSPASASYDRYSNFEDRGNDFKQKVKEFYK